ncbi:SDR family NAD(P)-dependent oxidoreductase [Demequina sp.]|uniref:SDR family NAD(P)-dependent oxidoreductase n=1 Tax=Demequina sp. TaxID=2050685 RepID=UPI003D09FF2B
MSVAGKLVVIAGATSAAGIATARALAEAGARVVAVGRDAPKLVTLRESCCAKSQYAGPTLATEVCDLTDETAVRALADHVRDTHGQPDGLLHLVGGWRGGGGLAGQSDEDYQFLEASFTALRHVSRAFYEDLSASEAGRLAVVSSTTVVRPLAGGANYAAVKAATEAWARAIAQGFAKDARSRDAARDDGGELAAASVIFRVKSLAGHEDELATAFVHLWDQPAAELNDTTIDLTEWDS